jgi:CheY-like chemotaxis protein
MEKHYEKQRVREGKTGVSVTKPPADFSLPIESVLPYLGHQLRTPLAAILGSTEMMFDSQQPLKDRLRCLNNIRRNVASLTDLAEELGRKWEGLSGQSEQSRIVEFSLLPFLSEIYETCRAQAWKHRLNLRVQFEGKLPDTVRADAKRLRQVLCSVIGDTIEATERGEILVTFSSVQARDPSPQWKILVSMFSFYPSPLPRVFQSNEQRRSWWELLKSQAKDLGANLCQPLPRHSRNHEVALCFPVGKVHHLKLLDNLHEKDLHPEQSASLEMDRHCLEGASVLIVEDTREVQLLLSHLLERFGAKVGVANDGVKGLEQALNHDFDFILLDLELPLMNGYEVVKQVRRQKPQACVFALTAHASQAVRADCFNAGFDDYLTKPIHVNDLVHRLTARWPEGKPHRE